MHCCVLIMISAATLERRYETIAISWYSLCSMWQRTRPFPNILIFIFLTTHNVFSEYGADFWWGGAQPLISLLTIGKGSVPPWSVGNGWTSVVDPGAATLGLLGGGYCLSTISIKKQLLKYHIGKSCCTFIYYIFLYIINAHCYLYIIYS